MGQSISFVFPGEPFQPSLLEEKLKDMSEKNKRGEEIYGEEFLEILTLTGELKDKDQKKYKEKCKEVCELAKEIVY